MFPELTYLSLTIKIFHIKNLTTTCNRLSSAKQLQNSSKILTRTHAHTKHFTAFF